MGDAGVAKENDILEKYNFKNIDFLKVVHHGSDTSSGKKFIILLILNIRLKVLEKTINMGIRRKVYLII